MCIPRQFGVCFATFGGLTKQHSEYLTISSYPSSPVTFTADASTSLVSPSALPYAGDNVIFTFNIQNAGTTSLTK